MPLTVEAPGHDRPAANPLVIGLINNMPDPALEATEAQFTALLAAAAGLRDVRLRFSSLPEVPRGPEALEHIARSYWPLNDLLAEPRHALIITGTEPRSPALEEEPYWERMVQLLDWAQRHTVSSIWSCLAAHAAVQARDGIRRQRLPDKHFGVFEHTPLSGHPLLRGIETPLRTPHSRWNELREADLRAAGYTIASASPESGVDIFVKSERSLFVGLQGHPEYEDTTLLKEYRRDIGRFLRAEREVWPTMPRGYFSAEAIGLLEAFRKRAEPARDPNLLADFPASRLAAGLTAPWRPAGVRIYQNWLSHVAAAKQRTPRSHYVQVSSEQA